MKNGIFSIHTLLSFMDRPLYTSIKSITNGKVTAAGFDNSDNTNNNITTKYFLRPVSLRYFQYTSKDHKKKKVNNTSFRSLAHANDSTCIGCIPNKNAV